MNGTRAIVFATLLATYTSGCDEPKDSAASAPSASATASAPVPSSPPAASEPPEKVFHKKLVSECKPVGAAVDFDGDTALENEVHRKLQKDAGPVSPGELATIKSINLVNTKVDQIDPCLFPLFTGMKDLFLGEGDYDDLAPLQKLGSLDSLRLSFSRVKDLTPIQGLKRLDRLDISHTLVGDDELKPVGSLVNLTELMLDEDDVSDLTPLSDLRKLERLSIKKTRVKDLAPIASLRSLRFLYIADTPISDVSAVQPLIAKGMKLIQN